MKIGKEKLAEMQQQIKQLFPLYLKIRGLKREEITIANVWDMWQIVVVAHNNENRTVYKENGERMFPHKKIDMYPCNTNDKTLGTALKQIFNNICNAQTVD